MAGSGTDYDLDLTLVKELTSLLPVIHTMVFFNGIKMNATATGIAAVDGSRWIQYPVSVQDRIGCRKLPI